MRNHVGFFTIFLFSAAAFAGGGGGGGVLIQALQRSSTLVYDMGRSPALQYVAVAERSIDGWKVEHVSIDLQSAENLRELKDALLKSKVTRQWAPVDRSVLD